MVHVMRGTHPTTIGDEVTIGHSAVIHGCTIEDRVLVGMAAVLLNGVARRSRLASSRPGSLLPGGHGRSAAVAGDGPARQSEACADRREVAKIRWYADNYVAYRLDVHAIAVSGQFQQLTLCAVTQRV